MIRWQRTQRVQGYQFLLGVGVRGLSQRRVRGRYVEPQVGVLRSTRPAFRQDGSGGPDRGGSIGEDSDEPERRRMSRYEPVIGNC